MQLTLDLKAKNVHGHAGVVAKGRHEFAGQFATGWDGTIDYSFIDSYGHIGGVRPALDADNFAVGDKRLPPLDAPPAARPTRSSLAARRDQGRRAPPATRRNLQRSAEQEQAGTRTALLADGPFAMTYGMAEGTPHNVQHATARRARSAWRGSSARLHQGPRRRSIAGGHARQRPAGTGPVADAPGESADRARDGQSHLAVSLRPRAREDAQRFRRPRTAAHASGIARSSGDAVHPQRLVGQGHASPDHAQRDVSASRPRTMPSAIAADAAASSDLYASFPRRRLERRGDSRRDPGGQRRARSDRPAASIRFRRRSAWGYTQHGPFSAVYDHNKRSVYLMTQRLKRHPFLALFDGADPNATTAERLATTVPTQALFFLNDPFIHAKAEKWAARLLAASADENATGSTRPGGSALGRTPTDGRTKRGRRVPRGLSSRTGGARTRTTLDVRALAAYLRTHPRQQRIPARGLTDAMNDQQLIDPNSPRCSCVR